MNGYPDGMTQATHDKAHREIPPDVVNQATRMIEDRARCEVETNHPSFHSWCADYLIPSDVARIVGCFACKSTTALNARLSQIISEYQSWRVAQAQRGTEWDEVIDGGF